MFMSLSHTALDIKRVLEAADLAFRDLARQMPRSAAAK
jgi:hypothetical protein